MMLLARSIYKSGWRRGNSIEQNTIPGARLLLIDAEPGEHENEGEESSEKVHCMEDAEECPRVEGESEESKYGEEGCEEEDEPEDEDWCV